MSRSIALLASLALPVAVALAGCQTSDQYQADLSSARAARLQSHVGRTVADFLRTTGLTPSDAYPVSGGKVFIVDGPTVGVALPASHGSPGVARTFACRIQLNATPIGRDSGADNWRVTAVRWTGPC